MRPLLREAVLSFVSAGTQRLPSRTDNLVRLGIAGPRTERLVQRRPVPAVLAARTRGRRSSRRREVDRGAGSSDRPRTKENRIVDGRDEDQDGPQSDVASAMTEE